MLIYKALSELPGFVHGSDCDEAHKGLAGKINKKENIW